MKDFDRNLNDEVSDFAIRVSSSLQNEFSDIEDHRRGAFFCYSPRKCVMGQPVNGLALRSPRFARDCEDAL